MSKANPAASRCMLLVPTFCWLLCAAVAVSTAHALPATYFARHQDTGVAGIYQGRAATKDPAQRRFTLNLLADGAAIFTILYIGKEETTQHGGWVQSGNQIVLTFDAVGSNQPLRPITFRHRNHELSPLHWDGNDWGRSGPPILHRAPANLMGG